jgi:hypothetical protein
MKQIVTAMAALLLAGYALAGMQTYDMLLHSGATTKALTIALPAAGACTTQWQRVNNARDQSLYWRLWVNKGATDSARVKIDVQRAVKDTNKPITAADTLISVSVCNVLDTTANAPECLDRQFYVKLCFWERFIITALSGHSDSSHVGNMVLTTDDGN